jgi:hypothetical protein
VKVVSLAEGCKIREDYKPILRAEGHFLSRFNFPGFVQCYESWGTAHPTECAPATPRLPPCLAICHIDSHSS